MIRKLLIAAAASISLASCAGVGVPGTTSQIDQIRNAAVLACGFLPTVETVAGIIATYSGTSAALVTTGSQIADSICSAVVSTSTARRRRGTAPRVNGVVVRGSFVR